MAEVGTIIIVGGGLAGAKAAEAARDEGFDGQLLLLAEEHHRPYERPPLSKGLLTGDKTAEDAFVHPADFYADRDIDLRLGDAVAAIDRDAGVVVTTAGDRLRFDRLLLATGAEPRRLRLGADGLGGIVALRTLDDSRDLAQRLHDLEHITVVGAGWIGCEVAAAARSVGTAVTMVDPLDVPLERVLGTAVGRVFAEVHREHGVDLRMGVGIDRADGSDAVEQVTLSDGTTLRTELVVVGVGVVPRTELAEKAGLTVDNGIVVDETLASSDSRIFAAGDVARAWHPPTGAYVRVEHWANALHQGTLAGRNLLGAGAVYDRVPYFFTDQYDLGMEYSGYAESPDAVVFRGSVERREFLAFWLESGRVVAGMNVNVWDVVDDIQRLIGTRVDPDLLADVGTDLGALIPPPGAVG